MAISNDTELHRGWDRLDSSHSFCDWVIDQIFKKYYMTWDLYHVTWDVNWDLGLDFRPGKAWRTEYIDDWIEYINLLNSTKFDYH